MKVWIKHLTYTHVVKQQRDGNVDQNITENSTTRLQTLL